VRTYPPVGGYSRFEADGPRIGVNLGAVLPWINGPFGGGKTATAYELRRRVDTGPAAPVPDEPRAHPAQVSMPITVRS
jgi:hypothetical protein